MHMPWQEGDQSHVCILSISIVSPLSLWEHGKRKIAIVLERRTIVTVM
jgi:hypothetical protein